jgi:uncharacterized membrane protein
MRLSKGEILMTWRGSVEAKDRFFAALVYLLPLIDGLPFGQFLFTQIPILGLIYLPIQPLIALYYNFPFASLIIFFALFLLVVRNDKISHFIRFNTMQAILVDILLVLGGLVLGVLGRGLGDSLITQTLYNVILLGSLAACLYSMFQSIRGSYAEIPTISKAAYDQVRW